MRGIESLDILDILLFLPTWATGVQTSLLVANSLVRGLFTHDVKGAVTLHDYNRQGKRSAKFTETEA